MAGASKSLKIYDTLAGEKRHFLPKDSVKIFLCGPTVYDYSHVGHARMLLFYDLAARYMRYKRSKVSVIVNITDIDPKIFKRANEVTTTPQELATHFIDELLLDVSALGIDSFIFAKVSDYISIARWIVKGLLKEGKAYAGSGNVYLDTKKSNFGILSKMTRKEVDDCRLDIAPDKESPSDILLWNASEQFDVSFCDSTLGDGIPWWHMQDTSVAMANFNGTYDIHGGANELVYPHHEAQLAQLRAIISAKAPVRLWTHVGIVYVKGQKMSKSLGNTITIRELLNDYGANTIRLYLNSKHYRERFDFTEKGIASFAEIDQLIADALSKKHDENSRLREFMQFIENDFDTPGAIKVMVESARSCRNDLEIMARIFGLKY